jgi:hypothetical protein
MWKPKKRHQRIIIAAVLVVIAVVVYWAFRQSAARKEALAKARTPAAIKQEARDFFNKAVEKGELAKVDFQRATVWMQAAAWHRLNRFQKAQLLEKFSGMQRIIDGQGNITILSDGDDGDLGSYTPTMDREPVVFP